MTALHIPGGSPQIDVIARSHQRHVTGYWLATLPGQGFGIIHGTGPIGGTNHARFLGANARDMRASLHTAVQQLHAEGVYEVADGPDHLIAKALQNGSAWASGPASVTWDTLPTKVLAVVLTAALGGAVFGATVLGGEAAGAAATGGAEVAGGGAAAAGAETAASGSAGTAAGAAGGAAAGGAAGGVVKGAGKVAGKVIGAAAKNPVKTLGALSIAGLFTDIGWWKGIGMIVAGSVLVILAIRELT